MDRKVKLGIIGIGNMGSGHAKNIFEGKCPELEIVAIADKNPARLDWARAQYPETITYFDNAIEMLKKMTNPLSSRTRISDRVYVAYYTPVVDNEYTTQPCRISLLAKDDLVTNATTTAN